MESADLPKEKSLEPVQLSARNRDWGRWYWTGSALLILAVMAGISPYIETGLYSAAAAVLSSAAACILLSLHLETRSYPWYWRSPLIVLFGCNILIPFAVHLNIPSVAWFGALGSGLFVYCMLWVASVYANKPGLQPLATLALLLSIGILAKPAVAISCALLCALLFAYARRNWGGVTNSVLLLFTPAILCMLAYFLLNLLVTGFPQTDAAHSEVIPATGWMKRFDWHPLFQIYPMIWFPIGVLLARAIERKTDICDASYLMMLAFLSTVGIAYWMPESLSALDIQLVVYAGAFCLLALAPPQKSFYRALVLAGAFAALLPQIWN